MDFDPLNDLEQFGVINQTTMLATETKEVMEILKEAAIERYGKANILDHFADTSDTLCYATNENQSATIALTETDSDLAIVVGGYNFIEHHAPGGDSGRALSHLPRA
ncbi:MAG: hypothetical protein U5K69_00595 [Balneolaceae bacterium]|nr:hypothetical protein [Balneolaceae bacterium]